MLSSLFFIREQRAPISAIIRLAMTGKAKSAPADLFERSHTCKIPARSDALIDRYLRHVGTEPSRYPHSVPAHLFAQWGFSPMVQAIQGVPYPLKTALNGGCRLEIRAPIPRGEPLQITSRLTEIDDNGRRAILRIEVLTGTPSAPDALRAEPYLIIPFKSKDRDRSNKQRPTISQSAHQLVDWDLKGNVGREFAALTGDINPIHTLKPYARMAGFKGCILHGFSSLARATESIISHRCDGRPERLVSIEAKFTRAIVLPCTISMFDDNDDQFFVGHEAGGDAFVTGSYTLSN